MIAPQSRHGDKTLKVRLGKFWELGMGEDMGKKGRKEVTM